MRRRQLYGKGAALTGPAVHCDAAAMQRHDLFDHCQPQTVAFGLMAGVALVELVKDMRLHGLVYTRPMVGDGNENGIRGNSQG